jgi:hypothetical protein
VFYCVSFVLESLILINMLKIPAHPCCLLKVCRVLCMFEKSSFNAIEMAYRVSIFRFFELLCDSVLLNRNRVVVGCQNQRWKQSERSCSSLSWPTRILSQEAARVLEP